MTKTDPRIPVRQADVMAEVQRERDDLRAERDNAEKDYCAEVAAHLETIERLQTDQLEERLNRQQAHSRLMNENERLRALLAWTADAIERNGVPASWPHELVKQIGAFAQGRGDAPPRASTCADS